MSDWSSDVCSSDLNKGSGRTSFKRGDSLLSCDFQQRRNEFACLERSNPQSGCFSAPTSFAFFLTRFLLNSSLSNSPSSCQSWLPKSSYSLQNSVLWSMRSEEHTSDLQSLMRIS